MTKLYELDASFNYKWLFDEKIRKEYLSFCLDKISSFEGYNHINLDEWDNDLVLKFTKYKHYQGKRIKLNTDFPNLLASTIVFNDKSKNSLSNLLEGKGQYLPFKGDDGKQYYIFNINRVLDAIDIEKSITKKLDSDTIYEFVKYEFKPEIVKEEIIFRNFSKTGVFVSQKFVDKVLECKLKGFVFTPLWDSDNPEFGKNSNAFFFEDREQIET